MSCEPKEQLVEERIDRVLTQYRESPNLLFMLRTYLGAVADVQAEICDMPAAFDLDTTVGDQLTLLGKRMGWGRCHCVCDTEPVFGFACEGDFYLRPIVGFCDPNSSWDGCSTGISEICLNDDETYRKFLKVRVYQYLSLYDLTSLEDCLKILFGADAGVLYAGQGRIVVTPGRDLTQAETSLLQLYPRVLPVALGIRVTFHFGIKRVFGFGEGWGGLMEPDYELTAASEGYQRTEQIFGFCDDMGGFCEVWEEGGLPLETERIGPDGENITIVDENDVDIYTGALTEDASWLCRSSAPWMCEIDVRPYDC